MENSIISKRFNITDKPIINLNNLQKDIIKAYYNEINKSNYKFEYVECICKSKSDKIISRRDKFGLRVTNVICTNCGLIRQNPRLDKKSYAHFYKNYYRTLYVGERSKDHIDKVFNSQKKSGKKYYDWIKISLLKENSKLENMEVLEIGCSSGGILSYFKDKGHKCTGVDYDIDYLNFGKEKGLNLIEGDISNIPNKKKFDLIILPHVLEHFLDIEDTMNSIIKRLKVNGYIFVNVPGVKNPIYYYGRRADFLFYVQNAHTYYFTKNTLLNTLRILKVPLKVFEIDEQIFMIAKKTSLKKKNSTNALDLNLKNEFNSVINYIKRIEAKRPIHLFLSSAKQFLKKFINV